MNEMRDPHETAERLLSFRKQEQDEAFFLELNHHLGYFNQEDSPAVEFEFPIIYVVGLPRSGTTLLSQLLSRCFRVGYIDNLIARFWLNPVVGIRLSRAVFGSDIRSRINLDSVHGVTSDPWGPHEFGYFWRHWMHLDKASTHNLPYELRDKIDMHGLRSGLGKMTSEFGMPVVFKNIICGLQASLLTRVYPNSLFVLIERDPKAVAASILRCRTERYGDPKVWWSLKPSTFHEISALTSPQEQINRQLIDGAREFDQELSKTGVRCVRVRYEDLCDNPQIVLQKISDAVGLFGRYLPFVEMPPNLTKADSS